MDALNIPNGRLFLRDHAQTVTSLAVESFAYFNSCVCLSLCTQCGSQRVTPVFIH